MSQSKVPWLLALAVVLFTIAPTVVQAEYLSNYANAVTALDAPVYLRLNETGSAASLGSTVVNDGTVSSSILGMSWGVGSTTTGGTIATGYYAGSQPNSGIAGVGSSITIGGYACFGLEDTNTCATFLNYKDTNPDSANSKGLNVFDAASTTTPVAALDTANLTYSLFFKTTQTATDLDGTAYTASNYPPRLIASHPDNNTDGNRFDVVLRNGMIVLITGNVSGTTSSSTVSNSIAECTSGLYNDGNWHHLVAVRQGSDATNAMLFIDGVQQTLDIKDGETTWDPGPGYGFRIGTRGNKNSAYTGAMDEIAMWGRAFSSEEATGLFYAATVPEPSSLVLLITLLLGAAVWARRKS